MSERSKVRVAVVTGGSGALGRALVEVLLKEGVRVHVPWVAGEEARALELSATGEHENALVLSRVDLTAADEVDGFFAGVGEREGRLDVLCNLAGGFAMSSLEGTSPDVWDHMMRLNATSAFLCCRAAVPLMKRAGGGSIVNVAALPALEGGGAGMAAYTASKSAVVSLTQALARELLPAHITVNAVAPEILDTPANRRAMPDADRSKWISTEAAARVIAFLAGPEGAVVTGSLLALRRG